MDTTQVLVLLQETDIAEARAAKKLNSMPEKQAILETRHKAEEVRTLRARAERFSADIQRAVAKHEDEVASLDAKIEAEGKRILSGEITNHKELENISREIDALKRRRAKLEQEALVGMERADKAEEQVAKIDVALEHLAAREEQLVEEFKSIGGSLQTEIDMLQRRRAQLAGSLEKTLLDRYESLRQAKQGVGLGVLEGSHCTACRFELPGESLRALKEGPDLTTCPMCRRMLVVRYERKDAE